ncbi:hypothetical protein DSCA_43170 [Desulfosarcina alkanivorans]|uniref:Uncharacterized protein n=2 Tax=Desulfosarcina alkanivorans TaxID=571177 RepID=A0A5K7Z0P2_9BACT|nr:hypothetical protein DSCA_43170 [Desulfosarcina alkanivorans]
MTVVLQRVVAASYRYRVRRVAGNSGIGNVKVDLLETREVSSVTL